MLRAEHPEVLARDWTPPVLIGRSWPLDELRRALRVPPAIEGRTEVAIVRGPSGSGTSAVARRAALDVVERWRHAGGAGRPLVAVVRVAWAETTRGVAAELLQRFDPDFAPHGFPVAELMAGFLRRLARAGRPAIVVLDDIGPAAPDLSPIVRALLVPERFLPEGGSGRPPIWLLAAGSDEPGAAWEHLAEAGATGAEVRLAPYSAAELSAIVRDRARRALGRDAPDLGGDRFAPPPSVAAGGARRAIELLRREFGPPSGPWIAPFSGGDPLAVSLPVEPRLLDALERAAVSGSAMMSSLKEWEARLAREEGARPLPATTLWRRIVRLEAAGIVRREVRTGGNGGTQSRLELLRPVPRASGPTGPTGTSRAGGSRFVPLR